MRFLGQTSLRVYHDDCEGLSHDIIEEHYGVDGPERVRQPHQSGAGNPMDEEDTPSVENQFEATAITHWEQMHKAVPVPPAGRLFHDDERAAQFYAVLWQVIEHDITPENFGLVHSEWEDGCYPVYKTILVGGHASKELHISLAEPIWYNQARLWCQAIATLSHFLDYES